MTFLPDCHVEFIHICQYLEVEHLPFEDCTENSSKFKIISTFCQLYLHKPLPLPRSYHRIKKMYAVENRPFLIWKISTSQTPGLDLKAVLYLTLEKTWSERVKKSRVRFSPFIWHCFTNSNKFIRSISAGEVTLSIQ